MSSVAVMPNTTLSFPIVSIFFDFVVIKSAKAHFAQNSFNIFQLCCFPLILEELYAY